MNAAKSSARQPFLIENERALFERQKTHRCADQQEQWQHRHRTEAGSGARARGAGVGVEAAGVGSSGSGTLVAGRNTHRVGKLHSISQDRSPA